jgi:hypothetical protein
MQAVAAVVRATIKADQTHSAAQVAVVQDRLAMSKITARQILAVVVVEMVISTQAMAVEMVVQAWS